MQTNDTSFRQQILEAAVAAPSGDNTQPWQFEWFEGGLDLWIDAQRSGRFSDSRYLLSDLALGACLENICIQASALGWRAQIESFPEPERYPRWVARLRWQESEHSEETLAAAIRGRHTDRSFPWKGVPAAASEHLQNIRSETGARILSVAPGRMRRDALQILRQAESLRFQSRTLHAELFGAVRFDLDWSATSAEGLAPASLAIEKPIRPVFKAMRHWPVMNVLNMLGAAPVLGGRAAVLPALGNVGLYLIAADSLQRTHVLAAGRSLERFWLTATTEGLSVQPFAAVGAGAYGAAALESRWLARRDAIREAVEKLLGPAGGVGLLFVRVGVPRHVEGAVRSGRRPIAEFDVNECGTKLE